MFKPTVDYPKNRLKHAVLDNGVSVSIGSAITPSTATAGDGTKYVKPAATTNPILGVVVGFSEGDGKVFKTLSGVTSITTAADNTTNRKIGVWYVPASDKNIEFEADVNADLGTTAGSKGFGKFALANDVSLAESSYIVITGADTAVDFVSLGQYLGKARAVVGRFIRVV